MGYNAVVDGLGPGILPQTSPYMYQPVKIDTRNFPDGYDIGQDSFVAFPGYKSGTVVSIGNAANAYADGFLVYMNGAPVGLQGGKIESTNIPEFAMQEFFTNEKGRFRISQLMPGSYKMTLYNYERNPVSFTVPEGYIGRFDVGILSIDRDK